MQSKKLGLGKLFSIVVHSTSVRQLHYSKHSVSDVAKVAASEQIYLQVSPLSGSKLFFPSNAFMASARSLHTFNRGKQLNCILHAGLSICRTPQKCRLWTSTQSRNCPSKRTNKKTNQKQQNKKTTKQKQQTNTKHTTKTKTKQKRHGIATSNGNCMHDDILCVILRMAQNKTQNRTNQKLTKGPRRWVIEATKPHAETRDPPSQDLHCKGPASSWHTRCHHACTEMILSYHLLH